MQYLRVYESQFGGVVDLHPLHGSDELYNNLEASRVIADHGYNIELLPELTEIEVEARQIWISDVAYRKNPDVRINGVLIGDIKTPNPKVPVKQSTINQLIYRCGKQKVSIAILNLMGRQYSVQDIKKGIVGALQPDRNRSIKEVWVITMDKRLFKAVRTFVFDDSIYEELNNGL
jgi:hypothetical protein